MSDHIKSNHKQFKKDSKKTIYSQFEYAKKKKKENEEDRESAMELVSRKLGISSDVLVGAPVLTSIGRTELVIENYKSIIEYTGNVIKVQTKICRIHIEGTNLNIIHFNNDEMKIAGYIQAIYYK